jgi:2-keto-3-deoxy-L-rhamnonate aldolase RhmA
MSTDLSQRLGRDGSGGSTGPVTGFFVACTDPVMTVVLAKAGFGYVMLDMEHGPISLEHVRQHLWAARAEGITCLVRLPDQDPVLAQRVLDLGVDGLVVPHVESAAEIAAVVDKAYFSPRGSRSMCPGVNAFDYSVANWAGYVAGGQTGSARPTIVALVESRPGLEAASEIAAVDGVDVLYAGLGDLSHDLKRASAGMEDSEVWSAWCSIRDAAHERGCAAMTGPFPQPTAGAVARMVGSGADLVTYFLDWLVIGRMFADLQAEITDEVGRLGDRAGARD